MLFDGVSRMRPRQLPSARLRDARINLKAFIERARQSAAFGSNLDFDAPCWDVTSSARKRASDSSRKVVLYFTTHENGNSKSMSGRTPMTEPFGSLIKAVVRLRHEANPRTPGIVNVLVRASRYLHDVLIDRDGDPCLLMAIDFQAAANACRAREKESSRYRVGLFLSEIADWLNRYAISKARIDFPNPFERVTYDHTRLGKEHERRRKEKLPSSEAFEALGQIANLVKEPSDVVRMRAVELLASAGFRINEALTLPEDCEVEEDAVERGNPIVGKEGRPILRYGIRYWPEKGEDPTVKWIATPMVDVVKRAIRDLRFYTAEARQVARWLEQHPGRAFLEPDNDQGQDQLFSSHDLVRIFNLSKKAGLQWSRMRGLPPVTKIDRVYYFCRKDIEAALLSQQRFPDHYPPIRMSEYLFIVPLNFCHENRATNPCVPCILTDQQIGDFLSGRNSSRGATRSVFERYGFTMPDGSPISLTSHMFRHWLNTLAQQGGMGEHEIARWFGRKDAGQNADYDHVNAMQKAEEARQLLERGEMRGGIAAIHRSLPPRERETFRETVITTAHTTDLGLCFTDWSLLPCPDHGSCARCAEHLIIKGDPRQKAEAQKMLDEQEWLLAAAIKEADEETYGASNYVTHIRSVVEGLRRIVAVHNDPQIPDGTIVHLNIAMPSRLGKDRLDVVADD